MKVDDERQMVRGAFGQSAPHDAHVSHANPAADKGLVERTHRQVRRERAKPRNRRGQLVKALRLEGDGQPVPPVVESPMISVGRLSAWRNERVGQDVRDLPPPLPFDQPQMPMHHVQQSFGRLDHRQLGAGGFCTSCRSEIW